MIHMNSRNLLLQTDSYKLTHFKQYPPGTEYVYSYLESRGGMFNETVFFGLQYYLKQYLEGPVVFTRSDILEAEAFAQQHFGRADCFNVYGWQKLFDKYKGSLPVKIRAIPEGTVVPIHNVLMTIENTDPEFPWLTNYLETILLKVWYPITVCTLSRAIKKVISDFHEKTGSPMDEFRLHDFGYRGVSSEETAAVGGAAHLVNFSGTDTVAGIQLLQHCYSAGMPGFSIPAAEHSTITSWGKENEYNAYKNMLDQFPEGTIAVVSDSYDLSHAVNDLWGWRLRDRVMQRDGTVVIRPDSGDPKTAVLSVLEGLGSKFGFETNSKGYRVLSPRVRVIQGDGVNYYTIQDVLTHMAKNGWAAGNVAFGMGGALLQQLNRDTQQFAIKCSSVTVNGEERDVWKETSLDTSKASKKGRLVLGHDGKTYHTIEKAKESHESGNLLRTVFLDGKVVDEYSLDSIRERAKL